MAQQFSKSLLVTCAWAAIVVVILSSLSLILVVQNMASKYDLYNRQMNNVRVLQERGSDNSIEKRQEKIFQSIKSYSMLNSRPFYFSNVTGGVKKIANPTIRREVSRILFGPLSKIPRSELDQVVVLSSLHPTMKNISRMSLPTPETFRNYIAPAGLPVIFTDMLNGQSLADWTWDYIRARWGTIVYRNIRQGNFSTKTSKSGKHIVNRVSVTLNDFIDVVTGVRKPGPNEEGLYIAKKRLIPVKDLEKEFFYPPFYPGKHQTCFLEPSSW